VRVFHLVVNLLTGTAVLAHALLGCGWHHGHEHVANDGYVAGDSHAVQRDHADHGHAHHEAADRSHGEERCPHDGPAEPCDEERCSYVTTGKVRLPDVEFAATLAVVDLGAACERLRPSFAAPLRSPVIPHGWATARLATQVWLL
jgi:hypothetical protein